MPTWSFGWHTCASATASEATIILRATCWIPCRVRYILPRILAHSFSRSTLGAGRMAEAQRGYFVTRW